MNKSGYSFEQFNKAFEKVEKIATVSKNAYYPKTTSNLRLTILMSYCNELFISYFFFAGLMKLGHKQSQQSVKEARQLPLDTALPSGGRELSNEVSFSYFSHKKSEKSIKSTNIDKIIKLNHILPYNCKLGK